MPPVSRSRLAESAAWQQLPQCPGYGHWVCYCCVALVFGSGFCNNHANLGWGLVCVCLGTCFGFASTIQAGVCGACVLALGFSCTPPISPEVLGCVCLCARSVCTPPFLVRVCGACVLAQVLALPRQLRLGCVVWVLVWANFRRSWLGYWVLCVCVRAPLVPSQSWLGCAWVQASAAPRNSPPGCWILCVCACAPPLARHSWLGFVVRVLGSGFGFQPASPGWNVPPCVFVGMLRLYPTDPCWGMRSGCVRLGSGFGFAAPISVSVLGCLRLCARSACSPPILARVCGTCTWIPILTFSPRILAGVLGRVCLCAHFACAPRILAWVLRFGSLCVCFACTPPILAGVRGVGLCAWVWVSAAPHHSWLGC